MYSNFDKLNVDKKELIINTSIKEFVQNGFDKASTNEIITNANISKGSLFNYFNSKKELYVYLIDLGVQVIEHLYEQIDLSETDLFKRIENIGMQKLRIQDKYPQIFDFLTTAIQEKSVAVNEMVKEKVDPIYERGAELIYQDIDYSKFREGIDIEKAMEILNWTMAGFGDKILRNINTFENSRGFREKYFAEWQTYSDILKYSFYKENV